MIRGLLRRLENLLTALCARLYALACGTLPYVRPWHYAWSALHGLNADLREALPLLQGRVLDVGGAPYRNLCTGATSLFGVDEAPAAGIDLVVQPTQPWPLPSGAYDAALCLQTLGRVTDPAHTLAEMARLLRPGAVAVFSVRTLSTPGVRAAGTAPDLRFYTVEGVHRLLGDSFAVTSVRRAGGIGSALVLAGLGWVLALAEQRRSARLLLVFFFPVWIAFCAALNLAGVLVDAIDPTRAFSTNLLVVAVRKAEPRTAASGAATGD